MEDTFISGPMYFFDQSWSKQRRKRTRTFDKLCQKGSINQQPETNKKSLHTKSVFDGESSMDDDLSRESVGKSERRGRSDAPPDTNGLGNGNDDERYTEASPAALQEEVCGEISLLEEYRHAAPQLLLQLERLLRMCQGCEDGFFTRGLENVLSYTWRQLTDGAVNFLKRQTPSSVSKNPKPRKTKGAVASDRRSVDSPQEKIIHVKKKCRKKTHLEGMLPEESTNGRNKPTLSNGHKPVPCTTISFSISSEVCHEQGWVVQAEDRGLGDARWIALCGWAVERLQRAQIPIKEQNAALAERGFTHPLVLRHYNGKGDCAGRQRRGGVAYPYPPYRRPSITEPRQEEPAPQKLHYRINDGTSFLYYPSGHMAVCQSHSGLPSGGFYTVVFGDAPKAPVLATFTPSGHATVTHPISGSVTVWDQRGGVTYDPSGPVTRDWAWPPNGRLNKPITIEVTELISVRVWGVTLASLWFRADQERIHLSVSSLPNLAPPTNTEEVRSSAVALELSPEEGEGTEAGPGRRGRADQELRRLQRTVRNILEDWLEHYRQATGMCSPALPKAKDRPAHSAHSKRKGQSAVPPALGSEEQEDGGPSQPPRVTAEQPDTARTLSPANRLNKGQHVTETAALRLLANFRLETVVIPRSSEPVQPPTAPPGPCPLLMRAALLGQGGQGGPGLCRCSNRRMPLITDLEYDAFVTGQTTQSQQVLVVCVTPVAPPTGDALDQLYRAKNKNRSMPCTQCKQDSFRLVRYELAPVDPHNALLQQRNNIAPGMFLMYAGGRLLFADHIFNGYGCSARDLQKQVAQTREAYRQGRSLPPDFRFSPPVGVLTVEGGSPSLQRPRERSATWVERCAPQLPLLSRMRNLQTCDRAGSAQDTVASLTLRNSLQQQAQRTLPVTFPILPAQQSPQRAEPGTLAPGCISGL